MQLQICSGISPICFKSPFGWRYKKVIIMLALLLPKSLNSLGWSYNSVSITLKQTLILTLAPDYFLQLASNLLALFFSLFLCHPRVK
jgi:hypothetical protein